MFFREIFLATFSSTEKPDHINDGSKKTKNNGTRNIKIKVNKRSNLEQIWHAMNILITLVKHRL